MVYAQIPDCGNGLFAGVVEDNACTARKGIIIERRTHIDNSTIDGNHFRSCVEGQNAPFVDIGGCQLWLGRGKIGAAQAQVSGDPDMLSTGGDREAIFKGDGKTTVLAPVAIRCAHDFLPAPATEIASQNDRDENMLCMIILLFNETR